MKSKKVPPLLLTSDTAGKKTLDSVLDGTQGFEFKEYRRQAFPVCMLNSQYGFYSSVVLGDRQTFLPMQYRAQGRKDILRC